MKILERYINIEDIDVIENGKIYRDKEDNYCVKIIIWIKNREQPFTFSYKLAPADYKITKRKFWFNKKELIKYKFEELKNLKSTNFTNYNNYIDTVNKLDEKIQQRDNARGY